MSYLNDHSVLYDVAQVVADPKACSDLAREMILVMREHNGAGLAAPQLGIPERVIVVHINGEDIVMINPVVMRAYGDRKAKQEGCLSFPGKQARVRRRERVEVTYYDCYGYEQFGRYRGKAARVVQHEVDHLNGITIV